MATLPQISYLSRDWAGIKSDLLDYTKYYIPELTDFNESEVGIAIIELFAYVGDNLHYYLDRKLNEAYLPTAIERASVIKLCKLIDYKLSSRTASTVDLKFSITNVLGGDLEIPAGTVCQGYHEGKLFYFETTSGLTITAGNLTGTVGAREGTTYSGLSLGVSDGTELQTFTLEQSPILTNQFAPLSGTTNYTARLYVDEGTGPTQWYEVDSFVGSNNIDKHYIVSTDDEEHAVFEFGDNVNGKIPASTSPITVDIRTGGGKDTNVAAGTISVINTPILYGGGPISVGVTNLKKAAGGDDQETIDHARVQAPRSLRALYRAVTSEDFITLAQSVAGVAKASVRYDGFVENGQDIGAHTYVYIAPNGGGLPSSTLKEEVQTYLDERRLITTFPKVLSVRYLDIYIEATVQISKNYVSSQVQAAVEDAINEFYKFDNLSLGVPLRLSDFYHLVDAVNGVNYLNIEVFSIFPELAASDANSPNTPITIAASVLDFKKSFYDVVIDVDQVSSQTNRPAIAYSKSTTLSKLRPDLPAIVAGIAFDRMLIGTSAYNVNMQFENESAVTVDVTGDEGLGGGYTVNTVLARLNEAFTSTGWPVTGYVENSLIRIKDLRSNYLKWSNDITQSGTWVHSGSPVYPRVDVTSGLLVTGSGKFFRVTGQSAGTPYFKQTMTLPYMNGDFMFGGNIRLSESGLSVKIRYEDSLGATRDLDGVTFSGSQLGWNKFTVGSTITEMTDRRLTVGIEPTFTASGQWIDLYGLWMVSGTVAPNLNWLVTTSGKDMPVYTEGKFTILSSIDDEANATQAVFGLSTITGSTFTGQRGIYNLKVQVDNGDAQVIDVSNSNGFNTVSFNQVINVLQSGLSGKCTVSGDGAFINMVSLTSGDSSRIKIFSNTSEAPDREATGVIWGTVEGLDREYLGFAGTPFKVVEYDYNVVATGTPVSVSYGNVGTQWTDGYINFTIPSADPITLSGYTYKKGDMWKARLSNKKEDVVIESQEIPRHNNRISLTFNQDK